MGPGVGMHQLPGSVQHKGKGQDTRAIAQILDHSEGRRNTDQEYISNVHLFCIITNFNSII